MRHAVKPLFVLVPFLSLLQPALAQTRYDLTPAITISEVYDDNVNLDSTNKKADYLTMVSPGATLDVGSENSSLKLQYAPTIVRYREEDQNNTVRQAGSATLDQQIGQNLRLELTDTYLRSEDPLEPTEGAAIGRVSRNVFKRNNGQAGLQYRFGREDLLAFGYELFLLRNEDPTVDGGKTQNPFVNMTYWLNEENGLDLNYGFTKAEFFREDDPSSSDDHTGHNAGIGYIHRLSQSTRGTLQYDFTNRRFNDPNADYEIHDGSIGFSHAFAPDLSFSLEGGYFLQERTTGDGASGLTYDASLIKSFERGSFTFGGHSGWSETFLEEERRGFTKYQSVESGLRLRLMERVDGYADGSLRWDKDEEGRRFLDRKGGLGVIWAFHQSFSMNAGLTHGEGEEFSYRGGNVGIKGEFFRWFFLSLDYNYAARDGENDFSTYRDNRVMMTVGGRRMFKL